MEHVLKENEFMLLVDEMGNIPRDGRRRGFYFRDTRYLSLMLLKIGEQQPLLLASSSEESYVCGVRLANPTLVSDGGVLPACSVSLERSLILKDGMRQRLGICNHSGTPASFSLTLELGADFYDMMEVRGLQRERRGALSSPTYDMSVLTMAYTGPDKARRRTDMYFDPKPGRVELEEAPYELRAVRTAVFLPEAMDPSSHEESMPAQARVTWDIALEPGGYTTISIDIMPGESAPAASPAPYTVALASLKSSYEDWRHECAVLDSDQEHFNSLLRRSALDTRLLLRPTEAGRVPDGGVPWFGCFTAGASIWSALETLPLNPAIAVATLRYLAKRQGAEVNPSTGEEPGRIVQELRQGERYRSREMPYYSHYDGWSNEATPLFLLLFVETMAWLNDSELFDELWPGVQAAYHWMGQFGDADGDGYIESSGPSSGSDMGGSGVNGVDNLIDGDGGRAATPLVVASVQAYTYKALLGLSTLLARGPHKDMAEEAGRKARALKAQFNRHFWSERSQFLAPALDAKKGLVEAATSSAGICLYCGIVEEVLAVAVVRRLLAADMCSGWGIRSRSSDDPHYNPMGYLNGGVWPHESSAAAAGLRLYGYDLEAGCLMSQLFEAGLCFPYGRLPQLYCGFERADALHAGPACYLAGCSPYGPAAGAPVLLLQTILGLRADAASNRLYVNPWLPSWLQQVTVRKLVVGKGTVDLRFERKGSETAVEAGHNEAGVEVVIGPSKAR